MPERATRKQHQTQFRDGRENRASTSSTFSPHQRHSLGIQNSTVEFHSSCSQSSILESQRPLQMEEGVRKKKRPLQGTFKTLASFLTFPTGAGVN